VLRLGTSFVIIEGTVAISCVGRVAMPSEARSSSKDDKESEDEEDDTVSCTVCTCMRVILCDQECAQITLEKKIAFPILI